MCLYANWETANGNDLYVFHAPQASDDTVIIMTTNPMAGVMGPTTFLSNAKFDLLSGEDSAITSFGG